MRLFIRIVSTIALVLSAIWFFYEPHFEPAITFLFGLAGLLGSYFIQEGERASVKTEVTPTESEPPMISAPVRWTEDHEEALKFHTATQRSQSLVLLLAEAPKTTEELNQRVPPGDLEWTKVILQDVIAQGWVQRTQTTAERYELTDKARRMLSALAEIPEHTKQDAWDRVWRAVEDGQAGKGYLAETPIEDMWVDLNYIEGAGVAQRLRDEGYRLYWSTANDEARRVGPEGWEVVVDQLKDGRRVRYKVRDHLVVGGYLILLRKGHGA